MSGFAAMFCAALAALNIWIWVEVGEPINLAAAFFCGLIAVFNAIWSAR